MAEGMCDTFRQLARGHEKRLPKYLDAGTQIGAKSVRDLQRFAGTGVGGNCARMSPRNGCDIGSVPIDGQMHCRLKGECCLPGDLSAVEIKLDEVRLAHERECLARGDENASALRKAQADMAEGLDNLELTQHAARRRHLRALRRSGDKCRHSEESPDSTPVSKCLGI